MPDGVPGGLSQSYPHHDSPGQGSDAAVVGSPGRRKPTLGTRPTHERYPHSHDDAADDEREVDRFAQEEDTEDRPDDRLGEEEHGDRTGVDRL